MVDEDAHGPVCTETKKGSRQVTYRLPALTPYVVKYCVFVYNANSNGEFENAAFMFRMLVCKANTVHSQCQPGLLVAMHNFVS